ncbi:MAG: hypothetical protein CBB96_03635 [Gammaproteobacteria bacterium TMED36]|nr:MAG: hypothetical protein CBB96_03635 [Gammaproteobacteria bacterium TMED36]|tara:strand:+ start:724 stop:1377 length:654 start_codon:yes stop_codon:yes gene_type:complete
MKIVSVITARGGSKGIPKKNLVDLNGKPLIYYSIRASMDSYVGETWVSTDCEDIAEVSDFYGAHVLMRPSELAGDVIMPDEALIHFAEDQIFDILVFIQPTSPLIKSIYINDAVDLMDELNCDSIFTAHKHHWLPKWKEDDWGDMSPLGWDINNRPRRQDIDKGVYIENGMLYVTTRDSLIKNNLRYGDDVAMLEIPLIDSFQVDNEDDLNLIRRLI